MRKDNEKKKIEEKMKENKIVESRISVHRDD